MKQLALQRKINTLQVNRLCASHMGNATPRVINYLNVELSTYTRLSCGTYVLLRTVFWNVGVYQETA